MVQAHFKNEQKQSHEERFEENKWKESERKMILRQKEQGRKDGMQKKGGTCNEMRRMRNNSRKTEINVQSRLLDDPTYTWKRSKTKRGKEKN